MTTKKAAAREPGRPRQNNYVQLGDRAESKGLRPTMLSNSLEWHLWLRGLSKHMGIPVNRIVAEAIRDSALRVGFKAPPPRRVRGE